MKAKIISSHYAGHSGRILYDADAIAVLEAQQFDLSYWESSEQLLDLLPGRGSAAVIEIPPQQALLKVYFRGGLLAKLNKSLYVFSGYERSRALREFRLLQTMVKLGLPVPEPLGAYCEVIAGIFCRQALLTRFLPATQTLAQRLQQQTLVDSSWQKIGQTINKFHKNGIYHADLNANNILLTQQDQVFLVDFDKSEQRPVAARWQQANLQRLERSLHKLFKGEKFPHQGWDLILNSYMEGS